MRAGALAGGKRVRPFLAVECARLFGLAAHSAMPAAFAIEALHCYSLVHDDLPAMDNDDMRRGKPTVHVAFDEATAILAGDCLLTLAFEFAGDARNAAAQVRALARAAGGAGMVGGQMLDLAAEGRFIADPPQPSPEDTIRRIQAMKTGALIACACEMGALSAEAGEEPRAALRAYAGKIGLAFQIADDLLDAEGDAARIGKAVRKDADAGKATFVALLGARRARALLHETVDDAVARLDTLPGDHARLVDFARYVATRDR